MTKGWPFFFIPPIGPLTTSPNHPQSLLATFQALRKFHQGKKFLEAGTSFEGLGKTGPIFDLKYYFLKGRALEN